MIGCIIQEQLDCHVKKKGIRLYCVDQNQLDLPFKIIILIKVVQFDIHDKWSGVHGYNLVFCF